METKISQTKIKSNLKRKTNPAIIETINLARKNKAWIKLARLLSSPNSNYSNLNLNEIDSKSKIGDTIVIPGKILSKGDITKKIRICALSISESAFEKLSKTKSEFVPIAEEIKKNPSAQGIKILK